MQLNHTEEELEVRKLREAELQAEASTGHRAQGQGEGSDQGPNPYSNPNRTLKSNFS